MKEKLHIDIDIDANKDIDRSYSNESFEEFIWRMIKQKKGFRVCLFICGAITVSLVVLSILLKEKII